MSEPVAYAPSGGGEGAMGWAVEIPADQAAGFTLVCDGCGRTQAFPARFMGERVLQLGRARREGWGWRRDGRLVEHALGEGRAVRRVARLCPCCDLVERHETEGGLWGRALLEAIGALRAELVAEPVKCAVDPGAESKACGPLRLHPSGQLDLFGHPA